jgi:GDPmannose 4,6-dehydratase
MPEYTGDVTGLGTTRLLEAIRRSGIKTKFYQASSSEMFGAAPPPQNERTPFQPRSPYAIAKVYSYWMVVNYRDAYGIHASNGILFNHESPRRGEIFVTRKITRAIANILAGREAKIYLGALDAKRDWGFAPEFVQVMWLILQRETPDDYVVGTGVGHSVREFLVEALQYVGIEIEWSGHDVGEKGRVVSCRSAYDGALQAGTTLVEIDPKYFRPTEVHCLEADISKARQKLGWHPQVMFHDLVKVMIDYDMLCMGLQPPGDGMRILEKKDFRWTNHAITAQAHIKEGLG